MTGSYYPIMTTISEGFYKGLKHEYSWVMYPCIASWFTEALQGGSCEYANAAHGGLQPPEE